MKRTEREFINEAWWIDFMEDEVSPGDRTTMEMLFKHSMTDQIILENYRAVKHEIKGADPAKEYEKLLRDPIYLSKLKGQVMTAVETRPLKRASGIRNFIFNRLPALLHIMSQKSM